MKTPFLLTSNDLIEREKRQWNAAYRVPLENTEQYRDGCRGDTDGP
ncbi:hypothetical protein AB0F71_04795 [Kitasatospora sp. NPDC028055]